MSSRGGGNFNRGRGRGGQRTTAFGARGEPEVTVQICGHNTQQDFKSFSASINNIYRVHWLRNTFSPGQDIVEINVIQSEAMNFVNALNNNPPLRAQIKQSDDTTNNNYNNNYNNSNPSNRRFTSLSEAITQELTPSFSTMNVIDLSDFSNRLKTNYNVSFAFHIKANFDALCETLEQQFVAATHLSLNGNNIDLARASWLKKIFDSLPNITHLMMTKNTVSTTEQVTTLLDSIKHQLIFLNIDDAIYRPVYDQFNLTSPVDSIVALRFVHQWFQTKFPLLATLNDTPLRPLLKIVGNAQRMSFPIENFYNIPQECEKAVESFVVEYFRAFDQYPQQRSSLQGLYLPQTSFTFSLSKDVSDVSALKLDHWTDVINSPRNLSSKWPADGTSVFRGQQAIISTFCALPATQHNLNSFRIDAQILSNVDVMLTIVGKLEESSGNNTVSTRSFTRQFLLQYQGSGFLIKNEMMYLCSNPKND